MNDNKFELVKAMDTIVNALNDEEGFFRHWILVVPDRATDNDFQAIAEDEQLFKDVVSCFKDIMGNYLKHGIYVNKTLY